MTQTQQEEPSLSDKSMKKLLGYEKQQLEEQKETNTILWINTIFTILTGVAILALTIFQIFFK